MKKFIVVLMLFLAAAPSFATTRLAKLADDRYLITHQKQTSLGGQGKALRLNYEKAASLCLVLGYSWFEIKQMESKGRTWGSAAASTMEVKFHHEPDPNGDGDLLNCEELASEEQKVKMSKALQKIKH